MSLYSEPTREELEEEIEKSMIFVGVCKHLWVATLHLPSDDFDRALMAATEKAEHVAKGDDEADLILKTQNEKNLKSLLRHLGEESDLDADSNYPYN